MLSTSKHFRMSGWKQRYAKWLLALILGMCSLWQVEEVLVKFIEGSTTTTLEKQHNDHLPLPKVALCMKRRYNYGALAAMGLPDDYFSEHRHRTEIDRESPFPDLNQTWLKATWSREDVQMAAATGATHTGATILTNTEGIVFHCHICNHELPCAQHNSNFRGRCKSECPGHIVRRTLLSPRQRK